MPADISWDTDLRIVDFAEFAKQLHCHKCSSVLDLNHIQREERYGLASVLCISCHCGTWNDVHTSGRVNTKGTTVYSHNRLLLSSMIQLEMDPLQIEKLFSCLHIPVPCLNHVNSQEEHFLVHQSFGAPVPSKSEHYSDFQSQSNTNTDEKQLATAGHVSHQGSVSSENVSKTDAVAFENKHPCSEWVNFDTIIQLDGSLLTGARPRMPVKRISRNQLKHKRSKVLEGSWKAKDNVEKDHNAGSAVQCSDTSKLKIPNKESSHAHSDASLCQEVTDFDKTGENRQKTIGEGHSGEMVIPTHTRKDQCLEKNLSWSPATCSVQNVSVQVEEADSLKSLKIYSNQKTTATSLKDSAKQVTLVKKLCGKMCDVCGEYLSSCSALSRHRRRMHGDSKSLVCPVTGCKKSFARTELLESHMSSKHSEEKPFQCFRCGKQFGTKKYLSDHLARCGQSPYKCHLCDLSFKYRSARRDHVAKKHECLFFVCHCGKVYQWRTSLAKHQKKCSKS